MNSENDDLILPPHDGRVIQIQSEDEALLAYRESLPGLLPDYLIERLIDIDPFARCENRPGVISYGLTSTGYDVRLGRRFKIFTNIHWSMMDPKNVDPKVFHEHEGDYCIIPPNSYVLGESVETFQIPRDITCLCVGKSTYARCGIIVNVTPGEPDWCGRWTIEISNSSPVPAKVYANEGIMQVLFFRSVTPCRVSYADKRGKYQNDMALQVAKLEKVVYDEGVYPIILPLNTRQVPANIVEYFKGRRTTIPPQFQHFDSGWNLWDKRTIDPKEYD